MVLNFIGGNESVTKQGDKAKQPIFLSVVFLLLFFNTSLTHAFSTSLSWSANAEGNLLGYKLYYGGASGSYDVSIDIGNQTSYTVEGLSAGTYYFAITAYTAMDESGFSAEVSKTFFDLDTTPPVLSGVLAVSTSSTDSTIIWNTDEGATSRVEYSLDTSYRSSSQINTALETSHSRFISGLSPLTRYNYRVVSIDSAGNIGRSGNFSFTTTGAADSPDTTPPVVSNVTASDITHISARITWNTDEPANARVQYGLDISYSDSTESALNPSIDHNHFLANLAPSSTYNYHLISTDALGNKHVSPNFSFTTAPRPDVDLVAQGSDSEMIPLGAVLNLVALQENNHVELLWENSLDVSIAGVRIVYRIDKFPLGIDDGILLGDYTGGAGAVMSAMHVDVDKNITYYYLVSTYDSNGEFQATAVISSKPGFEVAGGRGAEEGSGGGGCGMIWPGDGRPPGPGDAAEMLTLLGLLALIWLKKGFRWWEVNSPEMVRGAVLEMKRSEPQV